MLFRIARCVLLGLSHRLFALFKLELIIRTHLLFVLILEGDQAVAVGVVLLLAEVASDYLRGFRAGDFEDASRDFFDRLVALLLQQQVNVDSFSGIRRGG